MDLDVGEKTLQSQGAPKLKRQEEVDDLLSPFSQIPRVRLKASLRDQRMELAKRVYGLNQQMRRLEEFEKTFSSLSEVLQDTLAPFYFEIRD